MKDNLDDLINNIDFLDSDDSQIYEINRILNIIDSYEMDEYQLCYLKGYLWNSMPVESNQRDLEVENNLKKSITLNGNYIYSKTELSFFYFDKKQYEKVIELLKDLDLSYFEQKNQLWKSLKLQELLLVSKLNLASSLMIDLLDDFLGLISSYLILPDEESAIPKELVFAVIENKNKKGMSKLIKNTYTLINSKKQKDYFDDKINKLFLEMI